MNKIITITRQFGSGGREIGKKLAEAYGIPFYDNEIISRAAKDTGFAEAAFERAEDKASNSLLYSIAMGMNVFSSQDVGFSGLSLDDRIFLAQSKVIRNVAKEGHLRNCWQMCGLHFEKSGKCSQSVYSRNTRFPH